MHIKCSKGLTISAIIIISSAILGGIFIYFRQQSMAAPTSQGDGLAAPRDMIGNVLVQSVYADRYLAIKAVEAKAPPELLNAIALSMQIKLVRVVHLYDKGDFTRGFGEAIETVVRIIKKDSIDIPALAKSQWSDTDNGVIDLLPTEPVLPRFYPVGPKFVQIMDSFGKPADATVHE